MGAKATLHANFSRRLAETLATTPFEVGATG